MDRIVACIGQSNSIIGDGYFNHLSRKAGVAIGNTGRIGASPSAIVPYFATDSFFRNHDFCVFDLAVVDQSYIWAGLYDLHSIGRNLAHGIAAALSAGCKPIIVLIPHRAAVPIATGVYTPPPLQQVYAKVCGDYAVELVDLTPRIYDIGRADPAALDGVYQDPDHLSAGFSREVADEIMAAAARPIYLTSQAPAIADARMALARVNPCCFSPPGHCVDYSSGLIADRFRVLKYRDAMQVPMPQFRRLLGVMINRARSVGSLRIEADQTIVKSLTGPTFQGPDFTAQFLPITTLVSNSAGLIRISATSDKVEPAEGTWQSSISSDVHIEIADLLIEV